MTTIRAAAVAAVADRLVGRSLDELLEDPGAINRELTWDSQLRWLGPDKGVIHMAVGAVMNAVWDLRSKRERRPLWATLGHLEPAEVVALVDWTYLADFLDPAHAREMFEERRSERDSRIADLHRDGLAAYTTSPATRGGSPTPRWPNSCCNLGAPRSCRSTRPELPAFTTWSP